MKFEAKDEGRIIPPPSDKRIQEFEEDFEIQFPKDYVRFIKLYNGAVPVKGSFDCNNHSYFIERFFCLLDDELYETRYDLNWFEIEVVINEFDARLSESKDICGLDVIPICLLFAGNMVCMDFRKDPQHPSICVWDNYKSAELSPVTYKAADSFTEFLNMLYY